ncbi:MAG: hypothetical protein ABI778_03755, partial [Ignavibacteriota bacterium]
MKKEYVFIIAFFAVLLLASDGRSQQLNVALVIPPNPSSHLSDWASRKETAILTIINSSKQPVRARLHVQLLLNGQLKAETKTNLMPLLNIQPGVMSCMADQLIPYENVRFIGGADQAALRTGLLPAGMYNFCCELIDENGGIIKNGQACQNFILVQYQPPVLIAPQNNSDVKVQNLLIFSWLPVTPAYPDPITYKLKICEVLPSQTPTQALLVNQTFYSTEVKLGTQFAWQANTSNAKEGAVFAWNVQALTSTAQPVGENSGMAQPFTFKIASSVAVDKESGRRRKPCITPLSPGNLCIGNVSGSVPTVQVPFSWSSEGTFTEFYLCCFENPCGKFTPSKTAIPGPSPHAVTTTSFGGALPGNVSAGLTSLTSNYPALGSLAYVSQAVVSDPTVSGTAIHNLSVDLSGAIEPGGAFTYFVCGSSGDGSVVC